MIKRKQNSQVFISVLIVLTIVLALGAGMLVYSRSFRDITKFQVETDKAYALAKSGIGIGESFLVINPCNPEAINRENTYNFAEGTIGIKIASTLLNNILNGAITSTGKSAGGKSARIVKKKFNLPISEILADAPGFVQLRDSFGAVKGYYNAIQNAINAAASGDEVRCMGSNLGVFDGVFKENITINKSLTFRGSYDPCFNTQDMTNTPTIIDGQQVTTTVTCSGISVTINIGGFIIRNGIVT